MEDKVSNLFMLFSLVATLIVAAINVKEALETYDEASHLASRHWHSEYMVRRCTTVQVTGLNLKQAAVYLSNQDRANAGAYWQAYEKSLEALEAAYGEDAPSGTGDCKDANIPLTGHPHLQSEGAGEHPNWVALYKI